MNKTSLNNSEFFEVKSGLWEGKSGPFVKAKVLRNTNFKGYGNLSFEKVIELMVEERQFSERELRKGDILLERSGGGPSQPVGRVVFFDKDEKGYSFSNFTTRIRVVNDSAVLPKYLYYFLLFVYLSGKTEELQTRTTGIRNLDFNGYKEILIPVLTIKEQESVIDTLDTLKKAIQIKEDVINNSLMMKRLLMSKLFKEGYFEHKLKKTQVGLIPESWNVYSFSEVAKLERGKFSHRPRNDPDYFGGEVPFIQTSDITLSDGHIKKYTQTLNEKGLSVSRLFPKNTIVITIAANIGFTGILDFDSAFPDSIVGITPNKDLLDGEFLNYYLTTQQPVMDSLALKGTQKNINIQFLSPWPIIVPPLEEQIQISSILKLTDDKIDVSKRRKEIYDQLFKKTLDSLMKPKKSDKTDSN